MLQGSSQQLYLTDMNSPSKVCCMKAKISHAVGVSVKCLCLNILNTAQGNVNKSTLIVH